MVQLLTDLDLVISKSYISDGGWLMDGNNPSIGSLMSWEFIIKKGLNCVLEGYVGVHSDQNQSGDSESEYDPLKDDTGEGDLIDDENAKTRKNCNNKTSSIQTGGVKFRSRKRVYAEQMTPKVTRSKKSIAQQDASLTPSDIYGFTQHDDNTLVADLINICMQSFQFMIILDQCLLHLNNFSFNFNCNVHLQLGGVERRDRGNNMGRGLQRLNRACRGKLQVVITEGNIRPVVPLVAAKFATECNIIVRNHVPILPHWKLYKEKPASAYVNLFLGKLKAKFDINIEDDTVKMACTEMMKSAVRQQRYRLKQKYFDPFPLHLVTKTSPVKFMSNEQWTQLLESWKSPQKMEMCQKNKENRGNVKYHHTTGSRAYMVHVENLDDKYNDEEPNAFDLFKEFHYSKKKKCYTPVVQEAITRMENKLSTTTEGEELKSVAQVVADVLAENTKKNRFLKNVGFHNAQPRFSEQSTETELEAEKRTNAELRAQVADLSNKVQESEQARIKDREEMKRSQSEMEAKLNLLLSQIRPS
ncbi:uncharacterized protein [Oryza sativa Japonica Group]|uniref:uncharacterized protein n=1 Tax=Oryza sativa subsp. japonica TaxID=39947 RepID=UPI000E1B7FE4|nr:uncharacterized protein LOC4350600 [Oryza sativa Japonica Group]